MRNLFIGLAIITILLTIFLVYNHKQLPTKDGVFKITENWSPATEEVYLVKKIDGEWLTIFRNADSIMLGRLDQNRLGFWEIKDHFGHENTLAVSEYDTLQEELNWATGSSDGNSSYYFGQIYNPSIKRIEVETKKDFLEDALIISSEEFRFFYVRTEGELVMPVNIRGFTRTGELIYSKIKEAQ